MKCKCGYTVKYKYPRGCYNVGEVMEKSGFFPILDGVEKINWICGECYKKINQLAQQIYDIIDRKWVYLKTLLPKKVEVD